MPHSRLIQEEREARRRERSRRTFSDAAYRHYDPRREGYGSADEWIRTAEVAFEGRSTFHRIAGNDHHLTADMRVLGLMDVPRSINDLKRTFRTAIMCAHPDCGGTVEAARTVLEAFQRMAEQYK